ncbi:ABC transporter permease [uncultured Microbacterium sp.]|uniref:ABC transporter permease n=1 Tax=uncultured Microbacterium sp. TaxID=191216 RepID=UPI0025E6801B|nr:ABC transporter permease [uncultured Microbacterium sp.]
MTYIARRLGQAIVVLVLAYTVAYVLLALLPGDAVLARFGSPELGLSPAQLDEIRQAYGADRPVIVRFIESTLAFVRGDFGYSVQTGAPVSTLIGAALPETLVLAVLSIIVAVVLAVAIAFTATYGAGNPLRRVFRSLPPLFVSVPVFWIGIVLIQVFSFQLRIVPLIGANPVQALILPVLTIAIPIAAPLSQVLIRSIDEVRAQPFVQVMRARGAGVNWLLWHGVGRNALLPTLTMAGVLFGELIGGAVVTETVFGRAGIGQLTAQAVANRDTPVLMAVVVLSTLVFVIINLIVDLLYPVLDARLRTSARGGSRGQSRRVDASGTAPTPALATADAAPAADAHTADATGAAR